MLSGASPGQKCVVDTHGRRMDHDPITGSGGRAASGVQGQSPQPPPHWICINLRNDLWQKWGRHVHPSPPVATPLGAVRCVRVTHR